MNEIVQQPVPKLFSWRFSFQQGTAKSGSIPKSTLNISHTEWKNAGANRADPRATFKIILAALAATSYCGCRLQ
jgi:hypothetical protein